jgi:1-deoxy-D-xylulose-5-phosphate synthase
MAEDNTIQEAQTLTENFPRLAALKSPADIKALSIEELCEIAEDVRQCIIQVASTNGGHLASPLGAVEITIAMHYVYDFPTDHVIWDVGHQAHAHKILTGRFERFDTLRRKGGISGYPSRNESEFDCFGTGHSSTSISAALGMAAASELKGEEDRYHIAVIGDGAMTGGMAFEALSHGGHIKNNVLVVLNDNEMSISKNVGALSNSLGRLISGGLYNKAKGDLASLMEHTLGKSFTDAARRFEHQVKGMFVPGTLFEELGFRYIGPIDGNDIPTLIECFQNLKKFHKPILLHCSTQKGKGLPYAEEDPLTYHGVGPYDIQTGTQHGGGALKNEDALSFTDAFVNALIEAAKQDETICGITAAMPTGTGLSKFEKQFPERFFDVGICEQHAVTFAAGLATQGLKPVAAIYSTFLQRGYDQYIHDICLQNLPVVFAIDRAGLVGEDSPTQQGAFDMSFLRAIPNTVVMAPRDNTDTRLALHWALEQNGPVCLRYARTKGAKIGSVRDRDITRGEILRTGTDAYFLSTGPVLASCLEVSEKLEAAGLSIGVADARYIKPLDTELIDSLAHMPIITVEENTVVGGFGSAVMEYFEEQGRLHEVRLRRVGIPDRFLPHATRLEQLEDAGLDPATLENVAREVLVDVIQPS